MKAIGYTRVSTEEQARGGISLAAQFERIKAFSKAKDWELETILTDGGFSAKNLKRPGIESLIKTCRERGVDVVIVYKVDRLTRKQKDLWNLLEDVLEPNGVGLVSITEPFDTTTAMGKAFLGMLGVFAQLERDQISERTIDVLRYKKTNGEWIGRKPVGFTVRDKKLVEDPEEIRTIQAAKRHRRNGKSYREISEKTGYPLATIFKYVNTDLRSLKSRYA